MGHIDFTVGENAELTNFIFEALGSLDQKTEALNSDQ
jgi:hypothetical protein